MSWDYVIKRFLLFLAVIFVAVTINFIIPRLRDTNPIEERLYQLAAQGGVNVSKIKELTAMFRFGCRVFTCVCVLIEFYSCTQIVSTYYLVLLYTYRL